MALLSSLEEWEEEVGYILPREVFSQERIISAVSDKLESSLALSQRKQKMSVQTSTVVSLASCDSLDGKAMIIGETGQSIPGGENTLSPAVGAWSYSLVKESADEFDSCFEKESHCKGSPLTELNLSRNKLKSLPFALPCLAPNLKRLNISSNEFEELDPVAMLPQSLVYLNANSNSIANMRCTRRAKECCAKAKVNSLGTQPCQHQCHNTLPNLSGLCLRDNQLVRVELLQAKRYETEGFVTCKREVLFPSLMRLELRKNKLTTFPPDVAYLKELTSLDVSNNKDINRLPDDITQLPNLSHLPLDGLDLIDFPQTEMNQGAKRIQNFLRHRQDGEKPYRRMKLMVVGLAKKGKTTLVHRLVEYDSLKRTLKQTVKRILKRRHPPDSKPCQQTRSETVGIDITEMEYRPSKGKYSKEEAITFRIWDFAGQEKYYATHQCFLTRHSMYLVLWNLKDGTEGIENLASWLYNIEACAPGSPILIVGTHLDEVDRHDHHKLIAELERKYIFRGLGFPNVVGHIEVALVKRPGHVDNLCQKLFEVACEMRYSHDKTEGKPLLQQSFPASYMWLEKAVTKWRTERNNENRPPVITTQEFFELLEAKVSTDEGGTGAKCLTENKEELDHATRFLHDNGVLMNYYNDPVLKDLYFIDPNWLCEMAAKVVGKEANPYTKNGVLDISNLQQLFQGDEFPLCLQKYIALLEKFEVALRIDGDRLLIPSVLPETANEAIGLLCESLTLSCSVEFASSNESPLDVGSTPQSSMETRSTVQPTMSNHHVKDYQFTTNIPQTSQSRGIGAGYRSRKSSHSSMVGNKRLPRKLYRIYLIPFHPSGFWPRLVSRIRIDQSIQQTINQLIKDCGFEVKADAIQWKCWRRGLCMKICDVTVLSLEGYPATNLCNKWQDKHSDGKKTEERTFSIEIDGKNSEVKSSGEYCVEISVALSTLMIMLTNQQYPANSATVHSPMTPGHLLGTERSGRLQISPPALKPQMSPETFYSHGATSACPTAQKVQSLKRMLPMTQQVANRESAARHKLFYQMAAFLLSKSAYHIDTLLECWYEGLHSSESIEEHSTVKRIIPCLHCIAKANSKEPVFDSNIPPDQPKLFPFSEYPSYKSSRTPQSRLQQHPAVGGSPSSWIRKRFQPSGELTVVPKSSSDHGLCTQVSEKGQTPNIVRYVSLSSCIAHVYMASGGPQTIPLCSQHEEAIVSLLAPDVEFQDLFNSLHVRKSMVVQGMQLGEGGYGSVFQGYRISAQGTGVHDPQDGIAIKTFDQVLKHNPVADVAQAACLLYYTARAEVSIMMSLDHPNVLPLCGLCVNPLWLLTPRAPGGDLSSSLKEYRKNNLQILPLTLREVLIQIASGMEHIHEQNIIYHDLRPDNVLVWKFPPPGSDEPSEVCVKIADYGISQFVSSFGIKPGKLEGNHAYLAPEIVQYGGKEAYSKKADVFTYGLLIYQLLTLQKPYQGIDCGVIGRYLRGERPTVPVRCRRSFFSIHTLKQWCWTQDPTLRPQLSQVLEFLKSECFLRLVHHLPLTKNLSIMTGCAVNREKTRDDHNDSVLDYGQYYFEAWVSTGQGQISIVEYQDKKITVSVPLECSSRAHTMCAIRDTVWVGTEQHGLFVFSNSVPKRKLLLQRWPIVDSEADDFDHLDAQDAKRILAIVHDEVRKSVIVSVPDQTLLVFKDEVDHRADRESACPPMSNSQLRLLTRHNMADSIYCVTIVNQNDVWAGLDNGRIAILDAQSLMSQGKQNIIKMRLKISNPRPEETNFVKFLVTDGSGNESKKFVWCGLHGSRVVHQWDAATQQEAGHIDCFSVLWKEDVSDRDSRVTSMLVHAGYLFVGTGSGHVVVVAIPSMQILTTMLPHSGEVRCLIPFQPTLPHQMSVKTNEMLDDSEPFSPNASSAVPNCALQQIRRAAVLSCGLGLYGLTKQGSVHYPPDVLPVDKNDGHMLLWLADNWTT